MSTAIVIPVKNEKSGLGALLQELLSQITPSDEIVFVDAGSTDGTREFIRSYCERYRNIRLIVSEGATCGSGRNVGISQTNADFIAHIDGGNLPGKNWLPNLCAPLMEDKADYVTGNISFMRIPKTIFGAEIDLGELYGLSLFREFRREDGEGMAGGSSVAYKKWVWEKAGGLPDWCPEGGEDVLFVRKVERVTPGLRASFAKDALVYWQIGPRFKDVWKRKFRFQTHLFLLYETIPELLKGCFVPSFLTTVAILALGSPALRAPATILFLLEWGRQSAKVGRVFLGRKKEKRASLKQIALSLCVLCFLEGSHLTARICGLIAGLLTLREGIVFRRKAKEYLNTGETTDA